MRESNDPGSTREEASSLDVHLHSAHVSLASASHPSPSVGGGPSGASMGPTKVREKGGGAPGAYRRLSAVNRSSSAPTRSPKPRTAPSSSGPRRTRTTATDRGRVHSFRARRLRTSRHAQRSTTARTASRNVTRFRLPRVRHDGRLPRVSAVKQPRVCVYLSLAHGR